MELWLRYRKASNLQWDDKLIVSSEGEWRTVIENPDLISSILWPTEPLFPIGGNYFNRRHPHEKNYQNDSERNQSYLNAARNLAPRLRDVIAGEKALVYAPMRGALPIWKTISRFVTDLNIDVYYPVTSSFVFYPERFKIFNRKGKHASGRFNNVLELQRLRPFLRDYKYLIYIDEIISGGMMAGYLQDMVQMEINNDIKVIPVGMADAFGERSVLKRKQILALREQGKIHDFIWEGCSSLITQDQKFLLGVHYVDYNSGLNAVPVLNEQNQFYEEKILFDREVLYSFC